MKKLLFVLAVALAAPASAQSPTRSPTRSITYETGPCFGACPVYSVTIHSNGRATFTGRRFTAVTGTREFRVPAGTYLRFARHLEPVRPARAGEVRYSGDRCRAMATDLPSATVTWHGQGGGRSLYFNYGCDMQRNRALADRLRRAPDLLPLVDFIGPRGREDDDWGDKMKIVANAALALLASPAAARRSGSDLPDRIAFRAATALGLLRASILRRSQGGASSESRRSNTGPMHAIWPRSAPGAVS